MAELVVTDDLPGEAVRWWERTSPGVAVLAGGSTPRAFYERLAELRYPWEDVDVVPSDERCVAPDDPASNLGMIRRALLSKVPARPHDLGGSACDADAAEDEVGSLLAGRPVDLAVLGLGADGHTASLFPGDPALEERVRAVVRVERPDHPRLSLTLPVLSSARLALFLVSGVPKRGALRRLFSGEDVPAARVAARRVVVLADAAAAG
ncbi:MAG TPA: 6-phosphogluconolactonase [Actinomycetota bacterium]|nr:6-phosphogluconolactonase [Actinomycetota bacterium]